MPVIIYDTSTFEENRFKTISDFKDCMIRGGEVLFCWNSQRYGVFHNHRGYCIAFDSGGNEKWCDTTDEILEYRVGGDRLRDVITQVTVLDRTI